MKNESQQYTSDIAFTGSVKQFQQKYGSRASYAMMEQAGSWQKEITAQLISFLETIDTFYLTTVNKDGQPYSQHRGGPKGFLKVLDKKTLAFADFSGNKQFISVGNLNENNKAFIFLMDSANQTRIKIWGTAKVDFEDTVLLNSLMDKSYKARPERVILFTVNAWDVNCNQHIKQRFTLEEIKQITDPLNKRIQVLEAQLGKQ